MFKTVVVQYDDPVGDFQSNEVRGMNADRRNEMLFWMAEHD